MYAEQMCVVGGSVLGLVALGTVIDFAGRWAFVLGKRVWWRLSGSNPAYLDDSLAQNVATEYATKLMSGQDVPDEDKPDAIRGQALLIHTAIVDYSYRFGARN